MGRERPTTTPSNPTNATENALDGADRRALAELIRRIHRSAHLDVALAAADAVLAAGWRPPAPTLTTEAELEACRPGTVVTDRDGHPWVLNPAGQWCEPLTTGVYPDELLQWRR